MNKYVIFISLMSSKENYFSTKKKYGGVNYVHFFRLQTLLLSSLPDISQLPYLTLLRIQI